MSVVGAAEADVRVSGDASAGGGATGGASASAGVSAAIVPSLQDPSPPARAPDLLTPLAHTPATGLPSVGAMGRADDPLLGPARLHGGAAAGVSESKAPAPSVGGSVARTAAASVPGSVDVMSDVTGTVGASVDGDQVSRLGSRHESGLQRTMSHISGIGSG